MALWFQIRTQSSAPAHASWAKQIASVSLYVAAIPAAYYRPAASLVLIGIVAAIWLLPPKAGAAAEGETRKSAKDSATPQAENR